MHADCRDFCRDCSDRLPHLHTSQRILLHEDNCLKNIGLQGFCFGIS